MSNYITHLSFSRLKALGHSPLALKRYIEQSRAATKAMDEGTLLDCLLFEPDTFDSRFFVMPADIKKPTAAQLNAKKPSPETVDQVAAWQALELLAGDRIRINEEQLNETNAIATAVRDNSTVVFNGLLHPDNFRFQVPVDFFYKGFKHRGIMDASGFDRNGDRVIWDLKRMGARSGEYLVRAQIRNNEYDLQAAIYCHPYDEANEPVQYYVIAVDNEGYVTPMHISRDARDKARIRWNRLISAAHRCNMEGLDAGCEFWANGNGFFEF